MLSGCQIRIYRQQHLTQAQIAKFEASGSGIKDRPHISEPCENSSSNGHPSEIAGTICESLRSAPENQEIVSASGAIRTAPSEALNGCADPILTSRERKSKFPIKTQKDCSPLTLVSYGNSANPNIAKASARGSSFFIELSENHQARRAFLRCALAGEDFFPSAFALRFF
jgi:hypothetical protein